MGGYAAIMFALKYPERVNKIFSCSVKLKWDLESATKELEFLNPDKMMDKVPGFANNLMMIHGINVWKNLLKSTSNMMMDLAKGKLITDEDFLKIKCPVLFAIGDRDKTASLNDTIAVYSKVSNSQLLVMPNSPHEFNQLNINLLQHHITVFFNN
jgi:pimeloyl-ACP methyl ester carboxylesterase